MANAKDPAASPPVAPRATLDGVRVLLIISGGIAAYKSLELIRRLRDVGVAVQPVLTAGGARFITALAAASLAGTKCYTELFSLTDEAEMGHIRLARDCDLIIVAPASAHMMARMAAGMADDLATTVLLASDRPVLVAPAMNEVMWAAAATQDNLATLESRGVAVVGPGSGDLACGEVGSGRMAEVPVIIAAAAELLGGAARGPLAGLTALVTSGPTIEAVDPVRYIANRSSGRQGHAVAAALARLGARTTLVSGPVALADPPGVTTIHVESARQMAEACQRLRDGGAAPLHIAVFAAAVADWRPATASAAKLKKARGGGAPALALEENPDVLALVAAAGQRRPRLVIGFAAETEADATRLAALANEKRARKNCDWVLANDVSPGTATFGGADNRIVLVDGTVTEDWPTMSKTAVADRLARRIALALTGSATGHASAEAALRAVS